MSGVVKILKRDVLRLSLAALLFLAGFAGARMQGEMGALAALMPAGSTMLCSGAALPAGNDGLPSDAAHASCIMCNLPLADSVAGPQVARDLAIWHAPVHVSRAGSGHIVATRTFFARGPPDLG